MYHWYIVEGKNGIHYCTAGILWKVRKIYYCTTGIFNVYRYNDHAVVLLASIETEANSLMLT